MLATSWCLDCLSLLRSAFSAEVMSRWPVASPMAPYSSSTVTRAPLLNSPTAQLKVFFCQTRGHPDWFRHVEIVKWPDVVSQDVVFINREATFLEIHQPWSIFSWDSATVKPLFLRFINREATFHEIHQPWSNFSWDSSTVKSLFLRFINREATFLEIHQPWSWTTLWPVGDATEYSRHSCTFVRQVGSTCNQSIIFVQIRVRLIHNYMKGPNKCAFQYKYTSSLLESATRVCISLNPR